MCGLCTILQFKPLTSYYPFGLAKVNQKSYLNLRQKRGWKIEGKVHDGEWIEIYEKHSYI